jgi:hypothetical protein
VAAGDHSGGAFIFSAKIYGLQASPCSPFNVIFRLAKQKVPRVSVKGHNANSGGSVGNFPIGELKLSNLLITELFHLLNERRLDPGFRKNPHFCQKMHGFEFF